MARNLTEVAQIQALNRLRRRGDKGGASGRWCWENADESAWGLPVAHRTCL